MPIDLTNVPIGTKLRTRDGRTVVLTRYYYGHYYPYEVMDEVTRRINTHRSNGLTYRNAESGSDIVGVLGLASKYPTNTKAAYADRSS